MTYDIIKEAREYIRKNKIDIFRVNGVFRAVKNGRIIHEVRSMTFDDAILDVAEAEIDCAGAIQ